MRSANVNKQHENGMNLQNSLDAEHIRSVTPSERSLLREFFPLIGHVLRCESEVMTRR